jgi:hypothetical protein
MIKALKKLEMAEIFLNIIKAIYEKTNSQNWPKSGE